MAYSVTSPYYKTSLTKGYLDVITFRNITSRKDDIEYEVDAKYEFRPDLLAFDLYGDSTYWWIFSVRNKNILKDPIFDLVSGVKIFIPTIASVKSDLGI